MSRIIDNYLKYIPEEEQANFLNAVAHDTVNSLNKALQLDANAVHTLFGIRVVCSKHLGASDILVVDNETHGHFGVLGFLNGVFCKGSVNILPVFDSRNQLSMFVPKDNKDGKE